MSAPDDDEELTTVAPFRYETQGRDDDEGDDDLQWTRISRKGFTPPPGLSRRQRRRYRKTAAREARLDQRLHNRRVAFLARGQAGDGLGLPLLIVAIVVAGFVFWPRHSTPAPAHPPVPPPATATTTPPTSGLPAPSGPIGFGSDTIDGGTETSALNATPAGQVAYQFLHAFDTYDPAYPTPIATWSASWGRYATPELIGQAAQLAPVLWGTLAQQHQSITAGAVTQCSPPADTGTDVTWECDVLNTLFPIGGDAATPYSQQRWTWRIVVTDSSTATPRVDTIALLSTGDVTAASTAAPTAAATTTTAAPTTAATTTAAAPTS